MTDDKDFKRLVRQRMAKTGESYTAARAVLRGAASTGSTTALDGFRRRYQRAALDRVPEHLQSHYGVRVRRTAELDVGVLRVDLDDRPSWVVRVFPAERAMASTQADAAVLDFLARAEFPSERLAVGVDEAMTVLKGQAVLVTECVRGMPAQSETGGPMLFALGDLLGRLHTLADADAAVGSPAAGGWHHISLDGGGLGADVAALLPLVDQAADDVAAEDKAAVAFVRAQLAAVDACDDLPQTLIHQDPCGANAVVASSGQPVLVDWAGAGRGPRLLSLGSLLSGSLHPSPGVPPSRDLRRVDAVIAGYRKHVSLTAAESTRLAAAIAGPGIVLDCWSWLFHDVPLRFTAGAMATRIELAARAAERAAAAFEADLDDDALTDWFAARRPAVDKAQGALF